jgi:Transposase DDE domain group 1
MGRISRAKNRMRQSRSSGTVGGEGGNLLAYPANLIKLHKAQLSSDRMSCHSATANQVRLVLHTAAFWLMHSVRAAVPQASPLAKAEFATIRERLIKDQRRR